MKEHGLPESIKDCDPPQVNKAISLLKDLDWARSLEPADWKKRVEQEELL